MSYGEPECRDCGLDTLDAEEYYMVHDDVWWLAGMASHGGMLCIGCLERRLGRELDSLDFTRAPVNRGGIDSYFTQSPRLRDRVRRPPWLDRPTTT